MEIKAGTVVGLSYELKVSKEEDDIESAPFSVEVRDEEDPFQFLFGKSGLPEKFEVSDMSDFNLPGETFDFFVFPDVLEHIPVAQHARLFENIQRHAHTDSVVLIHIPAPRYLEWMIANQPEKLQVIDQPLDTGALVQTLGASDFYLEKMETYALFFQEKDYQYFVFRAKNPVQQSTAKSKWQVLKERILIRLKYGISS